MIKKDKFYKIFLPWKDLPSFFSFDLYIFSIPYPAGLSFYLMILLGNQSENKIDILFNLTKDKKKFVSFQERLGNSN